jgi:hypothetical protein
MDALVERLIEEETLEGETFRAQVEAWEAEEAPHQPSAVAAAPQTS